MNPLLAERLEHLVMGGNALIAEPNLDLLLPRIADLARSVVQARFAAIGLLAPDLRTLEFFVTSGLDDQVAARIGHRPQGHGILGLVIREARPIRLPDLASHPDSAGFPTGHPPMRSFLGVPVIGQHGVVGNLYLTEKLGVAEFSDEDEYLAVLLAGMAGSALENARHHEESARLLAEVQELMRSRERFFATVNHELRNSLAAVLGWAEMLVRRKDPAGVPKAAFEVLESAETAVSLINDLLDLSRLDEDRLKPVFSTVDCRLMLDRAGARVTPAANARGIRIVISQQGEVPVCLTDPHRVEQILVNILGNAVTHSPEGNAISVTVRGTPERVVVRVYDNGPGIPEENLQRIFDLYFTKGGQDGSGVGLGLPLARRLARLLGGELSATNRPEGGAVFVLELPVKGGP
ncbi:MAG TPA: GAF domain-containing sensor histidine kinase [Gemmatimonadales bacterium]